jgi:hypothetical protein
MNKFNLSIYSQMLVEGVAAGYRFVAFDEIQNYSENAGENVPPKCLLRHDIDADISAALRMAKVENEAGISATYFFMLRSPLYNLMGRENYEMAVQIFKLGHKIGLHYDQGFDEQRGWTAIQTASGIDAEANWLEDQFGLEVAAVSFHQPGDAVFSGHISTGKRVNTYDRKVLREFLYFSDSNRTLPLATATCSSLETSIAAHAPKDIQLLIHPIWWVYEDECTELIWNQTILSNFQIAQRQLIATERAFGSERKLSIDFNNSR